MPGVSGGRGITACLNPDEGTVTVMQSGSDVELDFTPQQVEDSEAFTPGEKSFLLGLFEPRSGGSCGLH